SLLGGLLDSSVTRQDFSARVRAQGEGEMILTPSGNAGNYFARRDRNSAKTEWLETLSLNQGSTHAIKFGSALSLTSSRTDFLYRPVEIRDSNGQTLEHIDFEGGGSIGKSDIQTAVFAQDHWTLRPNLSLDGGARLEYQDRTSSARLAPRVAAAWSPF